MKSRRIAIALLAVSMLATTAFAAPKKKASIKVINQSNWEIHHLFLSSSSDSEWGEDQLEDQIIGKGDSFTLTDIPCDDYDIRVVDEDGDECIIEAVEMCGDQSVWKITDKTLLACEANS